MSRLSCIRANAVVPAELHLDAEGTIALYDLETDASQSLDRFAEQRDRRPVRRLLAEAKGYLDQVRSGSSSGLEHLDDATRRQLEALGYLD